MVIFQGFLKWYTQNNISIKCGYSNTGGDSEPTRPPQIMEIQPSRTLEVQSGGQVQLFCSVMDVTGVSITSIKI